VLDWKTSASSKATVAFGTSLKDLSKSADATKQPDDSYEAKITGLTPGKQYYYTITATSDADQTKTDSYSGVFIARGFPVVITITENGAQAANAKIKIGSQNYTTDKSGKVSLELASGSYTVELKTQKGSKSATLTVAQKTVPDDGSAPAIQKFNFDVPATVAASTSSNNNLLLLIGGLVGGILLFGLFLFWAWRRRQGQDGQQQSTTYVAAGSDYGAWPAPPAPAPLLSEQMVAPTTPIQPTDDGSLAYTAPMDVATQPLPPMQPDMQQVEQPPLAPMADPGVTTQQTALSQEEVLQQQPAQYAYAAPAEPIQPEQIPIENSEVEPPVEPAAVQPPVEPLEPPAPSNPAPQPPAPVAEVIQTPSGQELQINHRPSEQHNSLYTKEATPQDMFEAAKNTTQPPQPL
jgi:hypothetical protein